MAPVLLTAGAALVVAGVALISTAAAFIVAGCLVMALAILWAVVEERRPKAPEA